MSRRSVRLRNASLAVRLAAAGAEEASVSAAGKGSRRRSRRRHCAVEADKKVLAAIHETDESQDVKPSTSGAFKDRKSLCSLTSCPGATHCFANISKSCVKDEYSATKWTHLSECEHICQFCLDEFSKPSRSWYGRYQKWKGLWTQSSRREPTARLFAAEELTPFWLQCVECGKWRTLSRDTEVVPQLVATFVCSASAPFGDPSTDTKPCDLLQDPAVDKVSESSWIKSLSVPGLLRSSPAAPFLRNEYYSEEVGMSPTEEFCGPFAVRDKKLEEVLQPFYIPTELGKALCLRPDVMEYDEIVEFPQYATERRMYLGLRNLIIALWNTNPKEWVRVQTCSARVICRGIVRIFFVRELERILRFLSLKGVLNFGILPGVCPFASSPDQEEKPETDVVVIGAGIAGLVAAQQLQRFGYKVCVVEAKSEIGGRIQDDSGLGVAVGRGAQLITGLINNPIVVMCLQTNSRFRVVTEMCPLLDAETGREVELKTDRRVDFHLNCLLDAVAHWRQTTPDAADTSLQDALMHMHCLFLEETETDWTEEEERLLQFQLGNLEFSCGASLKEVSALHWDQNEQFAQFAGDHAILTDGGALLLQRLAADLDILTKHQVTKIEYPTDSSVKIAIKNAKNGRREVISCQKALITIPLAALQLGNVQFEPELPAVKRKALNRLGAGIIEKVAVRFPRKFWAERVGDADYFGHVPSNNEERGLFNMFYDFSPRDGDSGNYVLMSYVCGEALNRIARRKDNAIVKLFVDTLQHLFPEEEIPEPDGYVVTGWSRDSCVGMSYSFMRVGSTGDDYDRLAADVQQRLFFAGEATNRHFPQTMTGAYLTGLREAAKIIDAFSKS